MNFEELCLDTRILRAVTEMGFEQASPIQAQAIPVAIEGKDMIGQAQTGTGNTTYFSLGTEWDKITDTYCLDEAGQNMFDYFNKPAIDDAISTGKEIRFSHNPEEYGECALKWEWDYLQEKHGYFALEKKGGFWYAKK